MISRPVVLDSTGKAERVGGTGLGFQLVPALIVGAVATQRAGSFPINVRRRNSRGGYVDELIPITNGDALFFEESFDQIDVLNGEASDCFLLRVFETRAEGVICAAGKQRASCTVQAATAVPTIVPVGAVGFRVRPGTIGHNFYFTGTLQLARIWCRSKGGTWVDSQVDIDATIEAVAFRLNWVGADRIYLQAAAGTMNVEVDATEEVG